jgi:hypothetical protein
MNNPICKVADIIYVRFELTEFEAQKKNTSIISG